MIKKILPLCLLLCSLFASAQTYTFECVASGRLSGDSCDICPHTIVESRSFNGLVIFRDSVFYRWLDQPYSIRVKPGGLIEYWEHGANPYSERVTIPLSLTGFATIQGMADSTWCNSPGPQRYQNLNLDSISATLARVRISGSNTGFGLRAGSGTAFDFDVDTLEVIATGGATDLTFTGGSSPYTLNSSTGTDVTFSAGSNVTLTRVSNNLEIAATEAQIANNGLSDNEAGGGVFRWGNRYMNGSDGLFSNDRKQNLNAFMAFHGDNSDSLLLVVDGTNDRVGVGRLPAQRLDVAGSSGTYIRVGTSGAVANAGLILNNSADVADTWAVYRQGDGDFAIGASADNEWPSGTLTDPFIIKPSPPDNSFYMDSAGKVQLGGSSPQRTLHVTGEVRITDLTTDTPTGIVGHDADGDLGAITVGSGLSLSGGSLTSTAGTFYQTMRDNGTGETQRAALNFISSASVSVLLTDDLANNETEAAFAIPNNGVTNALLRQSAGLSVIGRSANTTGNVADITAANDAEVLRRSGTTLGFGTVATAGITDDAVTYAKLQNVAANNVLLGNDNGTNTAVQELTAAEVQTMLGYIDGAGSNQRIAYFTDANTIAGEAAYLYDATNDRQTINCAAPGLGAGLAIMNLANVGTDGTGEFLQMSGNITGNMLAGMANSNTTAGNHTIFYVSQAGNSSGDALVQFNITGASGNTSVIGIDNSDGNKIKISPNVTLPGDNANASFVGTNDATPLWGVNKDAPDRVLDVNGGARAINLINTDAPPTASGLGNGIGTGGTVDAITGGNNGFTVTFTTGTGCVLDGTMFRLTFANAFTVTSHVIIDCHRDVDTIAECDKFHQNTSSPGFIDLKANGTLTDSKTHTLRFIVIGQ